MVWLEYGIVTICNPRRDVVSGTVWTLPQHLILFVPFISFADPLPQTAHFPFLVLGIKSYLLIFRFITLSTPWNP